MQDRVPSEANRDAAWEAKEQGRRYLELREYERAYRFLRRSYVLYTDPETAQLLQVVRSRVRADPAYCGDCMKYRRNCTCGGSSNTTADNSRGANDGVGFGGNFEWGIPVPSILQPYVGNSSSARFAFLIVIIACVLAVIRLLYGAPLGVLFAKLIPTMYYSTTFGSGSSFVFFAPGLLPIILSAIVQGVIWGWSTFTSIAARRRARQQHAE